MGTEPDLDSESKIWRLTDFGSGFLIVGSAFGFNFSDSTHPFYKLLFLQFCIISKKLFKTTLMKTTLVSLRCFDYEVHYRAFA